jgi:cytochrome c oxidase subunit 2
VNKPKQLIASGVLLTLMSSVAHAEFGLNMTQGVTDTSRQVYDLHMLILWVCVAIGVVVFGAMIYSMIYHRKSQGAVAAQFHESVTAELAWTIIPFVILIAMAIPATKVLIDMHDASEADMSIKVTGYQWKWRYEYIGEDVDFYSSLDAESNAARKVGSDIDPSSVQDYLLNVDNALVIPAGKKVRFLLTASDVIHAWWVPAFGWKKDAVPGFINEAWVKVDEPGVYRGQCAELCGRDHGFMPIVVEVKSQEDYAVWLAEQKGTTVAAEEVKEAVTEAKAAVAEAVEATETAITAVVKAADTAVEEVVKAADTAVAGVVATAEAAVTEVVDTATAAVQVSGADVYNAQCAACHQATGSGVPGVFPALTGSPITTGPADAHIDMVMNGKAGTAMAGFKDRLSDAEIAAVITYERNSLGNSVGDEVLPSAIAALR